MPLLAYFGISDPTINFVFSLLILFVAVIWFALIYWTYADSRRRVADTMLVWTAVAASVFPFVGTFVYMIVRPPDYLDDLRERELEMQASEARLLQLSYLVCPNCDYEVDKEFLICPACLHRLKEACSACAKPLEPVWSVCPYCETPVSDSAPARRSRRRGVDGVAATQQQSPPLS